MEEILDRAKEVASNHAYAVCWSGVIFDLQNRLVRADKMFLSVVHNHPVDGFTYRRLAPVIDRRTPDGTRERWLSYSMDACYRVTSGDRNGKVVRESDVCAGEEYRRTGLDKRFELGKRPWQFSETRKRDRAVIDLLQGLDNVTPVEGIQDVIPNLYLTVRRGSPRVRDTADALEFLRGYLEYDSSRNPEQNARVLQDEISIDAGQGRRGYPYAVFYGPGVIAAEVSHFGEWFAVPSLKLDLPHLKIT